MNKFLLLVALLVCTGCDPVKPQTPEDAVKNFLDRSQPDVLGLNKLTALGAVQLEDQTKCLDILLEKAKTGTKEEKLALILSLGEYASTTYRIVENKATTSGDNVSGDFLLCGTALLTVRILVQNASDSLTGADLESSKTVLKSIDEQIAFVKQTIAKKVEAKKVIQVEVQPLPAK